MAKSLTVMCKLDLCWPQASMQYMSGHQTYARTCGGVVVLHPIMTLGCSRRAWKVRPAG